MEKLRYTASLLLTVGLLKCTVFSAATSQPSDCITNVAMVLPTYLMVYEQCHRAGILGSSRLLTHP